MPESDLSLCAHLMRRAGFGARQDELETIAQKSYEAVVEDLLYPERFPDVDQDLLERYHDAPGGHSFSGHWVFRMINSQRQLQEKMALWCHQIFATGITKVAHFYSSGDQIQMFRRVCLTDLRTLLMEVSKDPAMVFWLDNNENHREEVNENYGRELLELFSTGVGNYTEDDVKACARAFTGWTLKTPIIGAGYPIYHRSQFKYVGEDHDGGVKAFLGEAGQFNGEDVIDIIVKQPAAANFISRHLYNFFVADEPPVASWNELPPQDPEAIDTLTRAYFDSNADFREILRVLLNADFFKDARFKKVKSPIELVTGLIKLMGTHRLPSPDRAFQSEFGVTVGMGQQLLNPLTVEGWHTGSEWIDGGTLNERVNFSVNQIEASKPGIRDIVRRLGVNGSSLSPGEFVDRCLDLAGHLVVGEDTRERLLEHAESGGEVQISGSGDQNGSEDKVVRMLQLIVSTREYQFG